MQKSLRVLMNYMQTVVRTDEEHLRLAMEEYAASLSFEPRKKAA